MNLHLGRCLACLPLALAIGCSGSTPAVAPTAPPIVQVATPIERTVTDYQIFTARTQAVESVDIKARVTGFLKKIDFKDGDEVKEGQLLFEIDDRTYKADLDKANADLAAAQASLVKTQALYDIGVNIRKQDPGAISIQELDIRKGNRDEAAASVLQAEAEVEKAQLYYDWCKVTAPISGRIDRHFVDAGNLVSQDVTLLTNIVSLKPTWAYFDVDENTVEQIQRLIQQGKLASPDRKTIPVEMGLGLDQDFPFNGAIDFISNQLDPNTGSIQVRASFPNEDGLLLAGMFGRVRLPIAPPHPALLVADEAVGTNQSERYVLVVGDNNLVEQRIVMVGQVFDGLREVMRYRTVVEPGPKDQNVTRQVEVLKPTDRVIVNGLLRVRPGIQVDPRPVDMVTMLDQPATRAMNAKPPTGKVK